MIHILGAGAMGCLWAAHLSHSNTVSFVSSRKQNSSQCSQNTSKQFSLVRPYEKTSSQYDIPILTLDERPKSIDTLLVCTKSYDTLSALKALKPKLSDQTKIILFQNGLGSQFDVLHDFPINTVFAAVSTEGANRKSDTKVIHAGLGSTQLGILNIPKHKQFNSPKTLETCYQLLATSLSLQKHEDIWQALWTKLIINCAINPFTALLDCSNGELKQHSFFQTHWRALKKELVSLMAVSGNSLNEQAVEKLIFEVMDKTQDNISSMLQDVRNNKPTEIDHINGFAYRYLKKNQLSSSINKKLWESVNALGS